MRDITVMIYYIAKLLIELIEEQNKNKHKKNRHSRPKH